jgi:hypothetical protein
VELTQSEIKKYAQELQEYGIDPNLAKQAAVVIVNSRRSLTKTERGQRIINRVYAQVQANPECDLSFLNFLQE